MSHLLGMGPILKCDYMPSETSLEKTNFLCKWLSTGDSFLIRDGGSCPLLSAGMHLATICACCLGLRSPEFLCTSVLLLGDCFLGVLYPLCLLRSSYLLFLRASEPEGRGLMETRLSVRTLCHAVQLWVYIHCRRMLF